MNQRSRALCLVSCLVAFAAAGQAPQPYSLPWQLRPAGAATVLRSDTAMALIGDGGSTVASMLLMSYAVRPDLAPFLRLGLVSNTTAAGSTGAARVGSRATGTSPVGMLNRPLGRTSAMMASSAIGAVFTIRAPGGQCASSASGTSDPA